MGLALVGLELWSGTALMPLRRGFLWPVSSGELTVERDEFPFGYWVTIGLHLAMLAFVWTTAPTRGGSTILAPPM